MNSERTKRFERLRRLRMAIQMETQAELARHRADERHIITEMASSSAERADAIAALKAEPQEKSYAWELWLRRQAVVAAENKIDTAAQYLTDTQNRIAVTVDRLREENRDLRAMESLLARLQAAAVDRDAKNEQAEADDSAAARYMRSGVETDEREADR